MNRLEAQGFLFDFGPFVQEDVLMGDGLTILQTDTSKRGNSWTRTH
jgi:hypothetical protein